MSEDRWPAWVYAEGEEPDYRFSLANERTFLAWLRTTLALLAEGVARSLAAMLLALGVLCPIIACIRWAQAERAMRRDEPLPSLGASAAVITGIVLAASAVLALVVAGS